MTVLFRYLQDGNVVEKSVPSPDECVLDNLPWGRADALFTPAYWLTQYWMCTGNIIPRSHRLGNTFAQEVAACLLGGHGIPAEVGIAAFESLRADSLIDELCTDTTRLAAQLRYPLSINGRQVTYRFWSQKAKYLADAFGKLREQPPPLHDAVQLRTYLLSINGIGYKTASWIVRNWLNSDDVAILDIHLIRAGQLMGIFDEKDDVTRRYESMEEKFLRLAKSVGVPAAELDALIWHHMRESPTVVSDALELTVHMASTHTRKTARRLSKQVPLPLN